MSTFTEPTATLLARISDNVLDDADWPIRKLIINQLGTVLSTEDVFVPVRHPMTGMPQVGWALEDLQRWASDDPTGEHPEVCKEFNTPTGTYYCGTYQLHMMQKLVRHAFDTEGMVIVQAWGVSDVLSKDVRGYTLHNTDKERVLFLKRSRLPDMSGTRPIRSPYLMSPSRLSVLRDSFIKGALPSVIKNNVEVAP